MRMITGLRTVVPAVIATIVIAAGCHDAGMSGDQGLPPRDAAAEIQPVPTPKVIEPPAVARDELVGVTMEEPSDEPSAKPSEGAVATFVVGDSTMVEAALRTGLGSAFSGHGFSHQTPYGLRNPLLPPPDDYEGLVVLGVSVWDVWATDLSGYQEATDHYRSLGHDVVWIEVPPTSIPYEGGELNTELQTLNEAVARILGCELQPWTLRNVESYGAAGEEHPGDFLHPTPRGGAQIATAVSTLTADDVCLPVTSSST